MLESTELAATFRPDIKLPNRPELAPRLERVFTVQQAAAHLGIGATTLRRLIAAGKIESFQPGCDARRITESQLSRFIERTSNGGPK
jgi:excisionase family DNA binding protein